MKLNSLLMKQRVQEISNIRAFIRYIRKDWKNDNITVYDLEGTRALEIVRNRDVPGQNINFRKAVEAPISGHPREAEKVSATRAAAYGNV